MSESVKFSIRFVEPLKLLSADQEEVYLTDPSGVVLDAVHYVNMPVDVAYARVPNGTGIMTHQNQSNGSLLSKILKLSFLEKLGKIIQKTHLGQYSTFHLQIT